MTDSERPIAAPWRALLRCLLWAATATALWVAYRATVAHLAFTAAPAYRDLVASLVLRHLPEARVAGAIAAFFLASLLNDLLDRRLGRDTGSVLGLFLPLLLTTAWGASDAVFLAAAGITGLWFVLRKVQDFRPALDTDAGAFAAPSGRRFRTWWYAVLVALLVYPLLLADGQPKAALVAFWLAVYALAFLAVGGRWGAWLKLEAFIGLPLLFGWPIAAHFGHLRAYPHLAALIALLVLGHLYLLTRNAARLRFYNGPMLAMVVVGVAAVEVFLAPLNLGQLPTSPPPESADGLGRVLVETPDGPDARFADRATDRAGKFVHWRVEVGRVRGPRPSLAKPAGVYRIVAIGSSATEGHGIADYRDVWPAVLGRMLDEEGRPYRVEVINAGIAGSTSFGMLLNFKYEMIKYHPDLLVLYLAHNDQLYSFGPYSEREMYAALAGEAPKSGVAPAAPERRAAAAIRAQQILSRSSLYRLFRRYVIEIRGLVDARNVVTTAGAQAVPLWDFGDNLREFAALCRENGVRLVFVGEAARLDLSLYKSMIATVAAEANVPYVDATTRLPQCGADIPSLFSDEVHLTVSGNRCVAGIIRDLLDARDVLPRSLP